MKSKNYYIMIPNKYYNKKKIHKKSQSNANNFTDGKCSGQSLSLDFNIYYVLNCTIGVIMIIITLLQFLIIPGVLLSSESKIVKQLQLYYNFSITNIKLYWIMRYMIYLKIN